MTCRKPAFPCTANPINHQVDTESAAHQGLFHGGDAAVHGDDQLHALGMELVDGDGVQAVALLQPPGDVAEAVCAPAAQKVGEQAGGGDAVHIVVAEDGDGFSPGDGKAHPLGGGSHVCHQIGVGHRPIAA